MTDDAIANTGNLLVRDLNLVREEIRNGQQVAAAQLAALRKETSDGHLAVRGALDELGKRVDKIETADEAQATRADERRRWCRHLIAAQGTFAVTAGLLRLLGWI